MEHAPSVHLSARQKRTGVNQNRASLSSCEHIKKKLFRFQVGVSRRVKIVRKSFGFANLITVLWEVMQSWMYSAQRRGFRTQPDAPEPIERVVDQELTAVDLFKSSESIYMYNGFQRMISNAEHSCIWFFHLVVVIL